MAELTLLKMNLLDNINSYIHKLNNENIQKIWIANGIPDRATEDDLQFIAEDDEL